MSKKRGGEAVMFKGLDKSPDILLRINSRETDNRNTHPEKVGEGFRSI
ncbi:MAG: hypothetical protein J7K08_06015 [Thermoplasmata archaeon]|nr:hypothetical protein [Thermoplasmata archaeon]